MTWFAVETGCLRQAYSRLAPLAPALWDVDCELRQVVSCLRGLSCMEECTAGLEQLSRCLEEQAGWAKRLAPVLSQAEAAYQCCEDRLSRQAEAQRR